MTVTKQATKPVAVNEPANRSTGLMSRMAAKFQVDPDKMKSLLVNTVFKGATDEQLMALLIVAEKYGLDPWAKQIYAFPSKGGGIVPIVGFDGWNKLLHDSPHFKSISFNDGPENEEGTLKWVECIIEMDNLSKPVAIKEYYAECYRDTDPWNQMPNRMTRNRSMVQCIRIAVGYSGIWDPDEGSVVATVEQVTPSLTKKPATDEPKRLSDTKIDAPHWISVDQATTITDKLKEEGVPLNLLLARYSLGSLESMPAAYYLEALKVIDELSTDAGNGSG